MGERLDRTSTFGGGCWERGGDFFRRGWCNFHMKNKLKCEISSDKKSLWAKKNFN